MKELFQHISQQLSQHFNQSIQLTDKQQVFGGDINQTFHLKTNIGSFFLKLNHSRMNDMLKKEFEGLRLLYQTNTIKIPEPVTYGNFENDIFLVTEFVQKGIAQKNFWQVFAQKLAALHQHSNDLFGLSDDNYIGSLQQRNNFCGTWPEFYATQRISPLAGFAFDQHKFSRQEVLLTEKLCNRFADLFPQEKPSLIHGDLWSGNFMCNDKALPVIYDPAIYYGNREMDIAMSLLFGGFDKSFYAEYNRVFPLQPGWEERIRLCQLYPLLVHLVLFGGHYYYSALEIIKAYL
jgi:fructosamine-3-kinase